MPGRLLRAALLAAVTLGGVHGAGGQPPAPSKAIVTRAERSNYEETSRYEEVVAFLEAVDRSSDVVTLTSFGQSFEGRALPLAIVGAGADLGPEAVRASSRLRVYLQANVHAGEVDGKEALLALVRTIAAGGHRAWLDSMILLVAPIYNADGNERVSPANRGAQHGPIRGAGTRANAQGLNINRDYIKLDTPEARSMVRLLGDYDPHVMIDLHTTNGSRHAYHLTYEVPNNPAVDPVLAGLARDEWMPAIARAADREYGWAFRAYGNVSGDPPMRSWTTVEDLPRYSHNYWGLRNRFGILVETYAYATFSDRILAASRFVEHALDYAHANRAALRRITEAADGTLLIAQQLSLRSRPSRSAEPVEILMGETADEVNPISGGVMRRRLDVRRPERMWEFGTFEPAESERVPAAYYLPPGLDAAADLLAAHGVRLERLDEPARVDVEEFRIASTILEDRAFEGHRERTVTGRYVPATRTLPARTWRVPMNQPLARLAFYLLEPRSNDGLLTWNTLDDQLAGASVAPIVRSRD